MPVETIEHLLGINLRTERAALTSQQLAKSINANLHDQVGTTALRDGRTTHYTPGLSSAVHGTFRNRTSGTRYQASGTTLYRTQVLIVDYRNQSLSTDTRTKLDVYKPLNDSTHWTLVADRGAMQKDNAAVARRWGIEQPFDIGVRDNLANEATQYKYRVGVTFVRFDGVSVAHESNPHDTRIELDRDSAKRGFVGKAGPQAQAGGCTGGTLTLNTSGLAICTASFVFFHVSGGCPPYRWTTTAGTVTISGPNNEEMTLRPLSNVGAGVVGTAYSQFGYANFGGSDPCGSIPTFGRSRVNRNCAGVATSDTAGITCESLSSGTGCVPTPICGPCVTSPPGAICVCPSTAATAGIAMTENPGLGFICDRRTPSMIAQGCQPCSLQFATAVVVVSDSRGASISTIVDPS